MDEGDGLENRCGRKVTEGSNPSPSAIINNGIAVPGEVPEWLIGAACSAVVGLIAPPRVRIPASPPVLDAGC